MNSSLFLATLCLAITVAVGQFDYRLDAEWLQWKTRHRKLYGMDEEGWRRQLWEKNIKMIDQHNQEYGQGKHSFTMAMNSFGDMTPEEFRLMMNGFQSEKHTMEHLYQEHLATNTPSSVDWREKGFVAPVKNQHSCGASWAFSAAGALEGQMLWKTGKLVSLSEQNLIDCSWSQGNEGCTGGLMDNAFQYVKDNGGLDSEEFYPYENRVNFCKYSPKYSAANITGFVDIPRDESSLREAVATVGPVSVGIDTLPETFLFYERGIYFDPNCNSEESNHGVLVVGYGFEGEELYNTKYWLIKNSWGEEWGIDGYMKLARDRNNHCGVASYASYPVCEPSEGSMEGLDMSTSTRL
uniref:Cathepsin L1-like isoform X2 n=1 Tax=Castor canadensis TaxID=51338 RepID=A0A8B7U5R9_CASCN|nr:cathepsin L1-like isoform X2 [Castor canadensis]